MGWNVVGNASTKGCFSCNVACFNLLDYCPERNVIYLFYIQCRLVDQTLQGQAAEVITNHVLVRVFLVLRSGKGDPTAIYNHDTTQCSAAAMERGGGGGGLGRWTCT